MRKHKHRRYNIIGNKLKVRPREESFESLECSICAILLLALKCMQIRAGFKILMYFEMAGGKSLYISCYPAGRML